MSSNTTTNPSTGKGFLFWVTFSVQRSITCSTTGREGSLMRSRSTGRKPCCSSQSICSPQVLISCSTKTNVNGIHCMWRRSTSLTSFNVREPEAKLRGLAYASSDSRLKTSKSAYEMTASPRITV